MKKLLTILTITTLGLLAVPSLTQAEDQKPPAPGGDKPAPGGPGGRAPMDPAARLKMMTEKLGLTQEQQDKIKAIYEKNAPAYKEAMAKGRENMTEEDRTKLRELSKAQSEEVAALLTPEQKEKMKEMRPNRRGDGAGKPGDAKPGDGKPADPK